MGYVDLVSAREARGWAFDPQTGASAPVEVLINGRLYAETLPDQPRDDLIGLTSDHGRHGFRVAIEPDALRFGRNEIEVRFAQTGAPMPGGSTTIEMAVAPSAIAGLALASVRHGLWHVTGLMVRDDELRLEGWAVPPLGAQAAHLACGADRRPLDAAPDEELRRHLRLPEGVAPRRFRAAFRFPPGEDDLRVGFGGPGGSFNAFHDLRFGKNLERLPDEARMRRVAGTPNPFHFVSEGLSNAAKIAELFRLHGAVPLAQARALDWGVGCGRVARCLTGGVGALTGVDIDSDNAEWCAQNLDGTFLTTGPLPPLLFADGAFDLIYGISVLTHLSQAHEAPWLDELRRIAAPGAILVLSTLGATAMAIMGGLDDYAAACATGGFLDLGGNDDLKGLVADGYYRNVAHGVGYIHDVWGELFEIVEIREAAIGNLQDAVVLRRR